MATPPLPSSANEAVRRAEGTINRVRLWGCGAWALVLVIATVTRRADAATTAHLLFYVSACWLVGVFVHRALTTGTLATGVPRWLSTASVVADIAVVYAAASLGTGTTGAVPMALFPIVMLNALRLDRNAAHLAIGLAIAAYLGLAGQEPHAPIEQVLAFLATLGVVGGLTVQLVASARAQSDSLAAREREADWLSRTFSRYFSPQVASLLMEQGQGALATGRREITVLFADLSGFTRFSEQASAEVVVTTLGEYLDELCRVALRHDGTLDKFMGDEIMVVFNAPASQADHARRAMACARDMQLVTELLNQERERRDKVRLGLTVGINSGEAVVGHVGGNHRVQYTAIGDAVNVAKRLQGQARSGEIVAGERTAALAGERMDRVEEFAVKNRNGVVRAIRIAAMIPMVDGREARGIDRTVIAEA